MPRQPQPSPALRPGRRHAGLRVQLVVAGAGAVVLTALLIAGLSAWQTSRLAAGAAQDVNVLVDDAVSTVADQARVLVESQVATVGDRMRAACGWPSGWRRRSAR